MAFSTRQARQERLLAYLRQRRTQRLLPPTIIELAIYLGCSEATACRDIEDLERTGQIAVKRYENTGRAEARTIVVTDWSPQ